MFHKSYPGTLFPIPFASTASCSWSTIALASRAGTMRLWSNYWQVTYTRYPDSVKVKSLVWPLSDVEKREVNATVQTWLEAESRPPAEPAQVGRRPGDRLGAGEVDGRLICPVRA